MSQKVDLGNKVMIVDSSSVCYIIHNYYVKSSMITLILVIKLLRKSTMASRFMQLLAIIFIFSIKHWFMMPNKLLS